MKFVTTYYQILGVDRDAKASVIRDAYRRLAREHHPDVSDNPQAHEVMAEINAAFHTLIDPTRRSEYDARLEGDFGRAFGTEDRERDRPETVRVRILHRLKQHRTPIYSVSFAPDTGSMVSSSFDNEVIWWDPATFEPQRRLKLEGGVVSTVRALDRDRAVAAGCSESVVSVWHLDGEEVDAWRNTPLEWVCCVNVSGDGRNLAMGSLFNTLQVCKVDTGDALFAGSGHTQSVTALAWSPDNRFVATGSADATVKLWSGVTGKELFTFKAVRSTVSAIAFSPDSRLLAVAAVDLSIRVFRLADLSLTKVFFGHEKPIEALAFHPNGILLASAGRDGLVGIWNAVQGLGHGKIEASRLPLSTVAFSPDGTRLVAGGLDRTLRVWDLRFFSRVN